MREDAPRPRRVPTKRRHLEDRSVILDRHIAEWLASEDITAGERRLLEAEKQRRKTIKPDHVIGLVAAEEGMTPPQFVVVCQRLRAAGATEVRHTRLPRKHHGALCGVCDSLGIGHAMVGDVRDELAAARTLVHEVDEVIAAPRESTVQTYATPGIWSIIGLARHRHLPVQVVLPDGAIN